MERKQELIALLNKMLVLLEPINISEFNTGFVSKNSNLLLDLELSNIKLGIKNMRAIGDNVYGVSFLTILATVTDVLVDSRLGVKIDDNGVILEFLFVS